MSKADQIVESLGFVPPGFLPNGVAYLADRRSPGAPTEGTDTILRLTADALGQAGVREGDLLVSTESAGRTVAVRCGASHLPAVQAAQLRLTTMNVPFLGAVVLGGAK